MKTKWEHVVKVAMAAGLMVLGLGMVQEAGAYKNPDTMTVYVTPIGLNYSVSITSPTGNVAGYDFGSVALQASTISTQAIVVTNDGTVGEYFALAVSNTSPDNWSAIASAALDYNKFRMMGHFVASGAAQPLDSDFSTAVDTMTATVGLGKANFGQGSSPTLPPNSGASNIRDLWLRLTMPDQVSSNQRQTMTLTINGQSN